MAVAEPAGGPPEVWRGPSTSDDRKQARWTSRFEGVFGFALHGMGGNGPESQLGWPARPMPMLAIRRARSAYRRLDRSTPIGRGKAPAAFRLAFRTT